MKLEPKFGIASMLMWLCLLSVVGMTGYGLVTGRSAKHDLQARDAQLNALLQKQQTNGQSQTNTTAPVSNQTTGSSASSSPTTAPTQASVPVSSSSANDEAASANADNIQRVLESYFATFGYYPGTLAPSEFAVLDNAGDNSGTTNSQDLIRQATSTPAGYKYSYTPAASGCSTAAHTCLHYTLTVTGPGGSVVITLYDGNS